MFDFIGGNRSALLATLVTGLFAQSDCAELASIWEIFGCDPEPPPPAVVITGPSEVVAGVPTTYSLVAQRARECPKVAQWRLSDSARETEVVNVDKITSRPAANGCEVTVQVTHEWAKGAPGTSRDGGLRVELIESILVYGMGTKDIKIKTPDKPGTGGTGGSGGSGGSGGTPADPGGYLTLGSDLTRDANYADVHRQDSIYWNTGVPTGHALQAPRDGQVVEVTIKGIAQPTENPPPADRLRDDVAIQVLRPDGDVLRVPDAGGSSSNEKGTGAPFRIPIGGDPNSTFSTFHPENLCLKERDFVALNTKGGWDETHSPEAGGYWLGIPFQVFSTSVPGAVSKEFHKHEGTGNGATLQDGVDEGEGDGNYQPAREPIEKQGQELLMQVKMAYGAARSFPCGGRNGNG